MNVISVILLRMRVISIRARRPGYGKRNRTIAVNEFEVVVLIQKGVSGLQWQWPG